MRKVLFALCALLLLVSVGVFASCGLKVGEDGTLTPIQKQLDTPSGLRVSDGNLCWNPVEYCNKYTVSIDGAEYYCSDYKYSLDGIMNGEHVFKVKANGDGAQYTSSAFSSEFRTELEGGSTVTRGYYSQFDDLSKNESFLGYGFDVINSNVFSDKYVKNSFTLFNKDQLMQQRLVKVDSKYSSVEETESTDIEEFMQEWNVKANVNVNWGGKRVGGSVRVQAAYSGGSKTAKSKYYHCISITNQKFYIVLQSDITTYKSMLNEGAANDLYSDMEPAQLFDRYGTHFITSAVMGGKINSYYLYTSEEETGFNDVSTKVSTEFRYFAGKTKVDVSGGYSDYAEEKKVKIKNTLDVLGGSDFGMLSDKDVGINYLNWEKSLNEHASLIGIKDSSSLVPIWELIDSEKDTKIYEWDYDGDGIIERGNRSAQLQAYFAAYGIESFNALREAAGIHEIVTPEQITNIKVNNLPAENGEYVVYAGDLNDLSFTVLPANALGYTKMASISSVCGYARINNDNGLALEIDANAPAGECIDIILSAGSVRETIKVRIQKRYTVMFHSNGGTNIDPLRNVLHGTQIDEPEQPKKRGFIFDGWYTDPDFADESMYQFGVKSVQSNLNLYAKWLPYYPIITFISNVKSIAIDSQTVKFNAVLEMPQTPDVDGYTFAGYYADAGMTSEFDFSQNIVTDTKIYVKWNINKYDVFFEANGGVTVEKQTVGYNSLVGKPTTTKVGYTFVGWYKDVDFNQVFDFNTETVKKSFTLYAKWQINKYDVFFETNGGEKIEKQTVDYNSKLEKPSVTKDGHTLIGWYKDLDFTQAYDFNAENVTGSFTLYAKWNVDRYDVFFVTNGGVAVGKQTVEYNSLLENPITTKAGYEFAGWYKDPDFGQVFDFKANKVTGSFALYAKWSKNLITVRFDTQGLVDLDERKVKYDSALGVNLPGCQKYGYEFKGWFKESSLETEVTGYTIFCDAEFVNLSEKRVVKLFAKWQANKSVIAFNKNGGVGGSDLYCEIYNSKAYSDNECSKFIDSVIVPSKTGYAFLGYYTDLNEGIKTIDESGKILFYSYGEDTILYAKWQANTYTLTFDLNAGSIKTIPQVDEYSFIVTFDSSAKLPVPSAEYYDFNGWFTADDVKLTDEQGNLEKWIYDSDMALRARWSKTVKYSDYEYIDTFDGLNAVRNNSSGKYLLVKDLDLGGSDWKSLPTFKGIFDGGFHAIYNFVANVNGLSNGEDGLGLFAETSSCALICNLIVGKSGYETSVKADGWWNSGMHAGGIVANNNGTITNCYVNNIRIYAFGRRNDGGAWTNVGGVAGTNRGNISKCVVENSSLTSERNCGYDKGTAQARTGGIVGYNETSNNKMGNISDCLIRKNIISSNARAWGHAFNYGGDAIAYSGGMVGYSASKNSKFERLVEYNNNVSANASTEWAGEASQRSSFFGYYNYNFYKESVPVDLVTGGDDRTTVMLTGNDGSIYSYEIIPLRNDYTYEKLLAVNANYKNYALWQADENGLITLNWRG